MSKSSRTLKDSEIMYLRQAQLQAARLKDWTKWREWMRANYRYSLVVRMALYLGHKIPGLAFYKRMLKEGQTKGRSYASGARL